MDEKLSLDQFASNKGLKKVENKNNINNNFSNFSSSKIFYFDEERNIVSKDDATNAIIVQYDAEGNIINEIFGSCSSKNKSK